MNNFFNLFIYLKLFCNLKHHTNIYNLSIHTIFNHSKWLYRYCKNFYNNDPYDIRVTCNTVLKIKISIHLSLIIIILLIIINSLIKNNINLPLFEQKILASQLIFPLMMPLNLRLLIQKYADFRQNLFNQITLKLLEIPIINVLIKLWHRFLFAFRIYSVSFGDYISQYISMNMLGLIISIIFSRLHIAGYLIIFCLLFLRLDFSVLAIARFYKKYPERLQSLYSIQKRDMWSHAAKVVQEAASNHYVQTAAVMTSGAVAWKALDSYEIYKQSLMQDKDIAAENARHAAEMEIRKQELAAENKRHAEQMTARKAEFDAEITVRKQELAAENRRHDEEMSMRKAELEHPKNAN